MGVNCRPVASVAAIMSSLEGFSLKTSLSLSWLLVSSGAFLKKNKKFYNSKTSKTLTGEKKEQKKIKPGEEVKSVLFVGSTK